MYTYFSHTINIYIYIYVIDKFIDVSTAAIIELVKPAFISRF